MGSDAVIKNLVDLIISEANSVKCSDPIRSIYHIQELIRVEIMKRVGQLRRAEYVKKREMDSDDNTI